MSGQGTTFHIVMEKLFIGHRFYACFQLSTAMKNISQFPEHPAKVTTFQQPSGR